jgi:DNA-binding GntR family transcriptional regulator
MVTDKKHQSNSAMAVDKLRELIFKGELSAGSNHLESELAERLGMSRTPVREAVLVLEAQGLVELRQRKGIRVLPLSETDMAEIYDILTELEALAAENAARAGYAARDLKSLSKAIQSMDEALEAGDRESWAKADDIFHSELVRLGGNSRLISIVAMMADQVRRARAVTLYLRPLPTQSNDDHRHVLEAIRRKDPDLARTLHRQHRTAAKGVILELLERYKLHLL